MLFKKRLKTLQPKSSFWTIIDSVSGRIHEIEFTKNCMERSPYVGQLRLFTAATVSQSAVSNLTVPTHSLLLLNELYLGPVVQVPKTQYNNVSLSQPFRQVKFSSGTVKDKLEQSFAQQRNISISHVTDAYIAWPGCS